ncbi:hypothetical protein PAPYR_9563 [Paratrimastix pyriformis]|uniref:Uncharacterized protein n=1 Tax=Paratrimastix pyriformis TaxID=342808 RepID=A0ABQ8U9P9_9EUKA|nr:hypothetical protein PAPYR_9563 [Paratrimastix pyriformis]
MPPVAVVDVDDASLLLCLPSELLPGMVEASASPLRTYIQLLSLCRATRTAIRGAPREMSFFRDEDDPLIGEVTIPTPDALAALVGPCKSLVQLTLPCGDVLPLRRRGEEAACAPWVSEAFGDHGQLAVLNVPSASAARVFMATLAGIVGHLPGLEQLHLGGPDEFIIMTRRIPLDPEDDVFWTDSLHTSFHALLVALGRSCPRLRVLHHTLPLSHVPTDALLPIAGVLTDLHAPMSGNRDVPIDASFIARLTSMQHLTLGWCSYDSLRPIASRLTQLRLLGSNTSESLADVGLCQLETLQLSLRCGPSAEATFARLIGANRNTLRTVILGACDTPGTEAAHVSRLLDPLNCLPHLTDLTVIMVGAGLTEPSQEAVFARLLTPGLAPKSSPPETNCLIPLVRIAGQRLRTLCLDVHNLRLQETTLELTLLGGARPARTRRLRSIEGLPGLRGLSRTPCHLRATSMPHLARVRGVRSQDRLSSPFLLQLLDLAPRLCDLSPRVGTIKTPAILRRLFASDSLTRLSLSVSATAMSRHLSAQIPVHGRTLQLPAQLERLEVQVLCLRSDMELVVDAPGLRSLSLEVPSNNTGVWVTLRCPALVALKLEASTLVGLGLADAGGPAPPLIHLKLAIPPFCTISKDESLMEDPAGVLELLGSRLRRVCLQGTFSAWPRLAAALGRLPRLAELRLERLTSPCDLVLACPILKRLVLDETRFRSMVFDCPLLEMLSVSGEEALERLDPAEGHVPPNLHLSTELWTGRSLTARFPWLRRVPHVEHHW